MRALHLVVLLGALAACSKSEGFAGGGDKAAASPTEGDDGPRADVLAAWKKGGLTPSAMTPAQVPVGKDCQTGTVGAVDVLLCVFPSNAEAKAAEDAGLGWVGDTTGAAQAAGKVLVAVADRRKADPSGRTINQMLKLAPH
jgi:hypothetical protein